MLVGLTSWWGNNSFRPRDGENEFNKGQNHTYAQEDCFIVTTITTIIAILLLL